MGRRFLFFAERASDCTHRLARRDRSVCAGAKRAEPRLRPWVPLPFVAFLVEFFFGGAWGVGVEAFVWLALSLDRFIEWRNEVGGLVRAPRRAWEVEGFGSFIGGVGASCLPWRGVFIALHVGWMLLLLGGGVGGGSGGYLVGWFFGFVLGCGGGGSVRGGARLWEVFGGGSFASFRLFL